MKDLFENHEDQPQVLKEILSKFNLDEMTYDDIDTMLTEVREIGFTFEYGLDAQPFNLTSIHYFKFVVPNHVEEHFDDVEEAKRRADELEESIFLQIFSKENLFGECYDEEELKEDSNIEELKEKLIKSFIKLTKN